MVKKIKIFILFNFCLFIWPVIVFAQLSSEIPTDENLSSSLMSLKTSAVKVQDRNQWLTQESQNLQQKINDMKRYLKVLDKKKNEAQGIFNENLSQKKDMKASDSLVSNR